MCIGKCYFTDTVQVVLQLLYYYTHTHAATDRQLTQYYTHGCIYSSGYRTGHLTITTKLVDQLNLYLGVDYWRSCTKPITTQASRLASQSANHCICRPYLLAAAGGYHLLRLVINVWLHLWNNISTTSIHWCLHWHASCLWLEVPAENLASTGGRRYGSTHQCLSIHNPGPLVVDIATTLGRSNAAVSEWVSEIPCVLG